jgi:hypothetical protein
MGGLTEREDEWGLRATAAAIAAARKIVLGDEAVINQTFQSAGSMTSCGAGSSLR